jgi:lisH domain-containing protein FOPNL
MASIFDLKDALLETLEAKGVLGQLKARVQAEVFKALDETVGILLK